MAKISVLLPVYRTGYCLQELYDRLTTTLATIADDHELLFVDDGSPDGAWKLISDLALQDIRVKAIRFSRNFGQHPALAAAMEHARGDLIVLMDSDLQDRPEDIPALLDRLKGEVEIVYSTKLGPKEALVTRITSRMYHFVFSKLTGTSVPRNIGTLRVFSRKVLRAILSFGERSILYGPVMFYVGFRYEVIAVQHDPRPEGSSGYNFRKRLAMAVNSILSYTDLPQRLLINFGAVTIIGSIVYAIALVGRYILARGQLPPGLTLLAMMITFSLGSGMFALGVIGLYVFRVYQEVLRRPRYIIAAAANVDERVSDETRNH
jgi:glycosyltransferase involved in cell wall biosynthesis